jgi:hypothetical protein
MLLWMDKMRVRKVTLMFFVFFMLVSCDTLTPPDKNLDLINSNDAITPIDDSISAVDLPGTDSAAGMSDLLSDQEDHWIVSDSNGENSGFVIQPGTPVSVLSWTHDCNWMGVGGQVFFDDHPINQIIVETGGTLEGKYVLGLSITGLINTYGSGGFEIKLSDHPVNSTGTVWIQLKDIAGLPLSEKFYLSSQDDCAKNLILINFVAAQPDPFIEFYYPILFR